MLHRKKKKGNKKTVKQNKRLPRKNRRLKNHFHQIQSPGGGAGCSEIGLFANQPVLLLNKLTGNTRLLNVAWLDWSKYSRLAVCSRPRWFEPLQSHILCVVGGFGSVPALSRGASL